MKTLKPTAFPLAAVLWAVAFAPVLTLVLPPALGQTPAQAAPVQLSPAPGPNASPSAPVDQAAVMDKAAQALSSVKTAQGKFSQIDERGQQASGAFYISRPGKVRFEYTSPEPMFIVSDGVSVSSEEPKRASFDSVPLASTPLHLFLRSNIDLKRDGSVTSVISNNGSYFITLVDKTGEAQGKMTLEFRASDFELLGWTTTDGGGAQTRVKLSETQKNVQLKPSLFILKDPADRRDDRR